MKINNDNYPLTLSKEEFDALFGLLDWYATRPELKDNTDWASMSLKSAFKKLSRIAEEIYGQEN